MLAVFLHSWLYTSRLEDRRVSSLDLRVISFASTGSQLAKELVEKLVKMAALQINTSKATRANGGLAGKTPELK